MKYIVIFFFLMLTPWALQGQSLSLDQCYKNAEAHAPRLNDRELIRKIGDLKLEQAGTSWLPSLQLNGKASYQSDVVEFALTGMPVTVDFPQAPHDQYMLNLDLRQNIYDGGMSGRKKAYERALTEAELQQLEVELYGLKGMVNQYYFPILVLQENQENLDLHRENLEARLESMQVALENGALLETELMVLQVEILKIDQKIIEVESQRRALLDALEVICGMEIGDSTNLELPKFPAELEAGLSRPEHRLFELQGASLDAGKDLAQGLRMPRLYAFGQTGYGRPGYNMVSESWDFYYMVGAGLSWTLWDWGQVRKEKQVLGHQQEVLKNARSSFDQELESLLVREARQVEQFRKTIRMEEEVLGLQEEISRQAATSLAHGTLTASDYIYELNKESMARIRLSTKRIQLVQSMASYLNIQGKL